MTLVAVGWLVRGHVARACASSPRRLPRWRYQPRPGCVNEHHHLKVYAHRIRKKRHDEQREFLQNDPSVGYRSPSMADGDAKMRHPGRAARCVR
jgi:hypothetical protein